MTTPLTTTVVISIAGLSPVGTGPYRVTEFVPGDTPVPERFPGHRGEAQRLLEDAGHDGEEMVVPPAGTSCLHGDLVAQLIRRQWAEHGPALRPQEEERATSHGSQPHDGIDLRTRSNPAHNPGPMGARDTDWSPNSKAARRGLRTPSPSEWEATDEAARFETDLIKRRDTDRRLLEIAEEDLGWFLRCKPHDLCAMREGMSFDIPIARRPSAIPLRSGEITVT